MSRKDSPEQAVQKQSAPAGVAALERGLSILRTLGQQEGLSLTEIAQRSDLNKATALRLLRTLEQQGFVWRDGRQLYYFGYALAVITRNLSIDLSPIVLQGEGLTEALTWLAFRETVKNLHFLVITLAGVLFVYLFRRRSSVFIREYLRSITTFIVANLIIGFVLPGIDNLAHLGGLIGGAAVGFGLDRRAPGRDPS
mgnify:CR=1 FL=1